MRPFTYATGCSGLEAATLAWAPLGWRCAFVSEIEDAPSRLLAHRFPDVPNLGDMNEWEKWPDFAIDLFAAGTPCQSFSLAGLRAGLDDPRGTLMLDYIGIAARYRPRWLVWENVPGVLSSNEGRDFATFLGALTGQSIEPPESGSFSNTGIVEGIAAAYGLAWCVLDAQYFGLAQRRERVFVVGHIGDWRPSAAVLLEPSCLRGDSRPRRAAGENAATTVIASSGGISKKDDIAGRVIVEPAYAIQAGAIKASESVNASRNTTGPDGLGVRADLAYEVQAVAQPYTLAVRGRGDARELEYHDDGIANAVLTPSGGRDGMGVGAIAFSCKDYGQDAAFDVAPTLRAMNEVHGHANGGGQMAVALPSGLDEGHTARALNACHTGTGRLDVSVDTFVLEPYAVRRLTPRECERLQGLPDDWTLVPNAKGKPMADSPRYKMIGNAWAVAPVRWIGERIALVDAML